MVSNDWLCYSIKHINCVNKWAFHELINEPPPPFYDYTYDKNVQNHCHHFPPTTTTNNLQVDVCFCNWNIYLYSREREFLVVHRMIRHFRIYRSANSNPTNDLNTNIQNYDCTVVNSFNSFQKLFQLRM